MYMQHEASWQPGQRLSNQIREFTGVKSNQQFRKLLQTNANSLIGINMLLAQRQVGGVECLKSKQLPPNPYLYQNIDSTAKPPGYQASDLKAGYIHQLRRATNERSIMLTRSQVSGGYKRPSYKIV